MKTDRWRRIDEILGHVVSLPLNERVEWLRGACADDAELLREIESLLRHCEHPLPFLEEPALTDGVTLTPDELVADLAGDPLIGRTLGRYRIDRRIASGGMGGVYEASRRDGDFQHRIAVKVLHTWTDPDELLRRFRIERQSLARLSHPNIAHLLDADVASDGTPYLMMELIDGLPIDEYCDVHQLDVTDRLRLFQTVCRAVHFAHQNLVIHRDLKPGNIMVTADGTSKLLDFGIAKMLEPEDGRQATRQTLTRQAMLTIDYASPEQLAGEVVTTETDVYSLGVVLYELLTGRRPYDETSSRIEDRIRAVDQTEPRRPSTAHRRLTDTAGDSDVRTGALQQICERRATTAERLHRRLRGDLDNIVMMAMRREPYRRYASAQELADDIQRHLDGLPIHARKDTFRYRAAKFVRRHRVPVLSASLLLLLVLLGTASTWRQARIAAGQRDAAVMAQDEADRRAAEARDAQARALHEAEHATIEAESAHEAARMLADAFLLSAPERSRAELGRATLMLDRELVRIRRQYADRPHLRANLLDAVGEVHLRLHLFDTAEALFDEAMEIRRREFGEASLEMARSLESVGSLHHARGEYQEAAARFEAALRLHRQLPAGVHTDVALAANNLAVTLRALGRLDEAEALHVEALGLRRAGLGGRSLLVAESMNNLAGIAIARGRYEDAESLLREALAIRRDILSESNPLVAQSLSNLAVAQQFAGETAASEASLREAVRLYRESPVANATELARALANLAGALLSAGEHDEARSLLGESLALIRELHGDDHPHTATVLTTFAQLEEASGHFESALGHWIDIVRIRRATLSERHPEVALALSGQAVILMRLGRPEEAEPLLRDAVAICRTSVAPVHTLSIRTVLNLAACLVRLDELDEAEKLLVEIESVLSEQGPAHARERQTLQEQKRALGSRRTTGE